MEIKYSFLNEGYIPQIYDCWIESFKEYHVDMSYMTLERLISRARMDRVDYDLSVGAFYNDKMLGFLLIGVDYCNNQKCAFDAGTGVIKEFRGIGIAGGMFDFAKPKLQYLDIQNFILEVIQDNEPAIKAYEKAGFEIGREFTCYKINTNSFNPLLNKNGHVDFKPLNKSELQNYLNFLDWSVSWEYNTSAINSITEELVIEGAFINGKCVGFSVFYPTLNWIFMLAVDKEHRKNKIGSLLMANLIEKAKLNAEEIKINNIISGHEMCDFLEKNGFKKYIEQYEMKLSI